MKLYVIKKTLDFASYLNRLIVVFLLKYEYFNVSFFKGLHKNVVFFLWLLNSYFMNHSKFECK